MNSAESFEDHQAGVFNEFLQTSDQEEVCQQYCLTLVQFSTRGFKIKVNVKMLYKFSYRVSVTIQYGIL